MRRLSACSSSSVMARLTNSEAMASSDAVLSAVLPLKLMRLKVAVGAAAALSA